MATADSGSVFAQEDVDPDDVLMEIDIADDGNAAWTIEYRMRLETDEDEQAFEDLRADIESDPEPYIERFQGRMDATADSAEEATGREMAITEMAVTAEKRELPREYGVVTYTFQWSNFAAVDGERLLVGDAIDGLFLDEDTSLIISWPDGLELLEASPSPSETRTGSAVYDGPTNFGSGEPRLEVGPPGAAPPDDTDRTLLSPLTIAVLVALLAVVAGGAFVANQRRDEDASPDAESQADDSDDRGAVGVPDPELLSNEEQVLQLIEQRGGRMKQKEVAEELDWTDAKTSQVTKQLREEGDLEGFRLGRENVLALPEERAE